MAVCRDCTVLDHKPQQGHVIEDVAAAEVAQRELMTNQLAAGREVRTVTETRLDQLQNEADNLKLARDAALKDITSMFDDIGEALKQRKKRLEEDVESTYKDRFDSLQKTREEPAQSLQNLSKRLKSGETSAARGPLRVLVENTRKLKDAVTAANNSVQNLQPSQNYLSLDQTIGAEAFQKAVNSLGSVVCDAYLPSKARFEMTGEAIAGLPVSITMCVSSYTGDTLRGPAFSASVINGDTPVQLTADGTGDGERVVLTPGISGPCKLVATFLGEPIPNSEFTLNVQSNNPVATVGCKGGGQGKFHSPRAVQVDKEGFMYVADTGNRVIQKLDSSGKFVKQFRIDCGNKDYSTCDVAMNRKLDVVICTETAIGTSVTPTAGNTIAIYSTEGVLKHRFTTKVLKCSLCVAVNDHGEIVVSDYLVHSLFMYDDKGTLIRRIGQPSSFNHPAFICIGPNDTIIVSDTNNDTVQMFNRDGESVRKFGSSGSGPGQLKQPFGVATDGELIFVVDSGNGRIQVFNINGAFTSVIESGDKPLNQPRGIAVTNDGHVLVADRDNHCIKKFKYK